MYSVIDIGSNTIRLVVYRLEDNVIKPMLNKKYSAGLEGYVNKNNCLSKKGILKAITILKEFKSILDMLPECEVFPFATASLRNISNTYEVLGEIKNNCGFDVRVLTGKEEALFDYHGAILNINSQNGLIVDVGGGSTELVLFANKEALLAESLPIGSLNLYKNYVSKLLPRKKELRKIKKEVQKQLKTFPLSNGSFVPHTICGVGGTVRAALDLYKSINNISDNLIEYNCSFFNAVLSIFENTPDEFTSYILRNSPDRIHTILPGIMILKVISETYNCSTIITSQYGVREGYLHHILAERGELNV